MLRSSTQDGGAGVMTLTYMLFFIRLNIAVTDKVGNIR